MPCRSSAPYLRMRSSLLVMLACLEYTASLILPLRPIYAALRVRRPYAYSLGCLSTKAPGKECTLYTDENSYSPALGH